MGEKRTNDLLDKADFLKAEVPTGKQVRFLRLQVSMNDALGVCCDESLRNRGDDLNCVVA